ncbi:MAG TPA: FAD-binding oxidoreductase [Devosia sp.]|nr:FAD-binding oxidoreductase [Devosia sp.]
MPDKPSQIIATLESLLGQSNVISEVGDMAAYINEPRKRFFKPALGVVFPRDVAGVQKLMRWANEHKVALIPQGGNTGLVGAQVPLSGREIIVSLRHLNAVRHVNAADGHMVVEAGLTLLSAHEVAEKAGALFPLTIASEGSATIGGVLSTNAGGTQVLAYGNARALCLGVEAVMADGALYNGLSALRKDNTGYDLRDLLIGAEGTLGIITAATLKLFAQPQAFETAWINVASPEIALQLFLRLRDTAQASLSAFELMPRFGVDIQLKHKMIARDPSASLSPWYVMAEISVPKGGRADILTDALEAAFESGLIGDATLASSLADRQNMWKTREQMSESQSKEGASIKHDVSVPVSAVPELIGRGCAVAEKLIPGIRPCPFGHLGDGNMHFNFTQPVGADPKIYMAGAMPLHEEIYEIVLDLGGSISAEHGIGQLKVDLLEQVKDPAALAAMVAIKDALDPNNILNPGKVLRNKSVSE